MDNKLRKLAKQVVDISREADKKKTSPYDTVAKVRRVEGDTVYVHIPGGVDETPVEKTINAHKGDSVHVRVSGGRAFLIGNSSSPPTDDRVANIARSTATTAHEKAVTAEETAVVADENATDAKRTAKAILIYDHGYTIDLDNPNIVHFTAYLYQGGVDIKTKFDPEKFTWALKTEDGETSYGYGYTKDFDKEDCGYGAEVIGRFNDYDDSELLTQNDDNLTNNNDIPYTVRADGEKVRISDLTVVTTINSSDKLLVSDQNGEHLITMDSLTDYLGTHIITDKHFEYTQATPSSTWEIEHNLGKEPSVSVVDSAGTIVEGDCEYVNTNKVILSFSSAFSGKAYLN